MRFRISATILALFCLAACDRFGSPQARVEACVGRFARLIRSLPAARPSSRGTVRYAFELRNPDPALERDGIEGVRPTHFTTISGSGIAAATQDAVDRVMNQRPDPKVIAAPSLHMVGGERSWLVYAPERPFSGAEARRHLVAMCALAGRGAILRSVGVDLPNSPR